MTYQRPPKVERARALLFELAAAHYAQKWNQDIRLADVVGLTRTKYEVIGYGKAPK
jgi:hypothetical protein